MKMSEYDKVAIDQLKERYSQLRASLSDVVVGQDAVIELVLLSIFSKGHALLVGVPGLAKTLLVSSLAEVLDLECKRIQFTPDLMPTDVTGTEMLDVDRESGQKMFHFVKGPIFANMVLADEINRTPPKTQSALLQAMQEKVVTVGDETFLLPTPFFVLATQNPIEHEGTYSLPEAQLDRFAMQIIVDYPTEEEERAIITRVTSSQKNHLIPVLGAQEILDIQDLISRVPVGDHVVDYASRITRATRPSDVRAPHYVKEMVSWGAGPRAGITLISAAKAYAAVNGRYHVQTSDVDAVALPVLRHRVLTTFSAEAAGVGSDEVIEMLLRDIKAS